MSIACDILSTQQRVLAECTSESESESESESSSLKSSSPSLMSTPVEQKRAQLKQEESISENKKDQEAMEDSSYEVEEKVMRSDNLSKVIKYYNKLRIIWPCDPYCAPGEDSTCDYCDNCLEQQPIGHQATSDEIRGSQNVCVYCDICNCMVHQKCYGSELYYEVPQDEWFCDRCKSLNESFNANDMLSFDSIKCKFCPELRGAIKRYMINGEQLWAHICCAEVLFQGQFTDCFRIEIRGKLISSARTGQRCNICFQFYGTVIKCQQNNCQVWFHITCGRKRGYMRSLDLLDQEELDTMLPEVHAQQRQKQERFCQEHVRGELQKRNARAQSKFQYDNNQQLSLLARIQNQQMPHESQQKIQKKILKRAFKQEKSTNNKRNQKNNSNSNNNNNPFMHIQIDENDQSLDCNQVRKIQSLDFRDFNVLPSNEPKIYQIEEGMAALMNLNERVMNSQELKQQIAYFFNQQLTIDIERSRIKISKEKNRNLYKLFVLKCLPLEIKCNRFYSLFKRAFVIKKI